MAGLLNLARQVGQMNPRGREPDESVFANRQRDDGGTMPAGPNGRGFGTSGRDDMEWSGGPETADMPTVGRESQENNIRRGPQEMEPASATRSIAEKRAGGITSKTKGMLNAGDGRPADNNTIDRNVHGRADGDFASQSGGNGVQGEGYMTPAEVAAGAKQTVRQTGGVNFSTEKSISFEMDGKSYVIPSIVNGKSYTPDAAIKEFRAGNIKPLGIFDKPEHAEQFSRQRSADLDAAFNGGHGFLRKGPSSPADGQLIGANGLLNSPETPPAEMRGYQNMTPEQADKSGASVLR